MDYYTATVFKNDAQFVAHCLELGISSYADTFIEAMAKLREDMWAYLKDHGEPDIPFEDVKVSIMRTEVELMRDAPESN